MAVYKFNLIDADSLVYAAGFACQTQHFTVKWDSSIFVLARNEFDGLAELKRYIKEEHPHYDRNQEPLTLNKIKDLYLVDLVEDIKLEPLENCLHTVKQMLNKIIKRVNASQSLIYLAPERSDNFRVGIDSEYKANRVAAKPVYYDRIREYIKNNYSNVIFVDDRLEVDDVIAITARLMREANKRYCITRIDKDLRQIPGTHYLWKKETFEEVGEAMARRTLWTQVLTGDSADNIKGLPKVGPVKAAKILKHIDWTDEDANGEALRTCGLEYAIRLDDPETELFNTISLVKLLTVNVFEYPGATDEFI